MSATKNTEVNHRDYNKIREKLIKYNRYFNSLVEDNAKGSVWFNTSGIIRNRCIHHQETRHWDDRNVDAINPNTERKPKYYGSTSYDSEDILPKENQKIRAGIINGATLVQGPLGSKETEIQLPEALLNGQIMSVIVNNIPLTPGIAYTLINNGKTIKLTYSPGLNTTYEVKYLKATPVKDDSMYRENPSDSTIDDTTNPLTKYNYFRLAVIDLWYKIRKYLPTLGEPVQTNLNKLIKREPNTEVLAQHIIDIENTLDDIGRKVEAEADKYYDADGYCNRSCQTNCQSHCQTSCQNWCTNCHNQHCGLA